MNEKILKLDGNVQELNYALQYFLVGDLDIQRKFDFNESVSELVYSFAYQFIQKRRYDKAIDILMVLCMANPDEKKYLEAFATSLFLVEDYKSAAMMYFYILSKGIVENKYFFCIGDCFLKINDIENARIFLRIFVDAMEKADDFSKKKNSTTVRQAKLLLENIK